MAFRGGFLVQAWNDTSAVHTADPAHAETNLPGQDVDTYTAVSGVAAPDEILDIQVESWVVDSSGIVLDSTPVSHEAGPGDYGASKSRNYNEPAIQFASETYSVARVEGFGPVPMSPLTSRRGMNGQPENMPPDPRPSITEVVAADRKLFVGSRTHDMQYAGVNDAIVIGNQRANVAHGFGSPFPLLARVLTRTYQTPSVARSPDPIDDSIAESGDLYPALNEWVM